MTGLRQNLTGLRPIRGLLLAIAVSRCSVMLYPFLAAYLMVTRDELSPGAIGLVIGAFGIGALGADVVSGALTARFRERSLAVAGLVGVAAVVLAVPFTQGTWTLAAATGVWGFCYELVNPIAYSLVARAMPEASRRFGFAAVRLAINAGMGIGPVLAGLLFKVDPGLLVWGTASGYLLAALVLARSHPPTAPAPAATERSTVDDAGSGRPEVRFWGFLLATLPIHVAYALPPTVISAYVIYQLHQPAGWASAIFATNAVLVITCEITLNHLMNGWRRRTTLIAGYLAAIVGFGLMGLGADSPWFLLAATAVWTVGEMIIYPVMLDHISAISPRRLEPRNMGFYAGTMNVGVLVAPLLFLPLSMALPAYGSWLAVAGLLVLGLVAVTALSSAVTTWGVDRARPQAAQLVDR